MVHRMFAPPDKIGRHRQNTGNKSPKVIGFLGFEKGSVSAVVKNDKDAHQKACRESRQCQRNPIGAFQAAARTPCSMRAYLLPEPNSYAFSMKVVVCGPTICHPT